MIDAWPGKGGPTSKTAGAQTLFSCSDIIPSGWATAAKKMTASFSLSVPPHGVSDSAASRRGACQDRPGGPAGAPAAQGSWHPAGRPSPPRLFMGRTSSVTADHRPAEQPRRPPELDALHGHEVARKDFYSRDSGMGTQRRSKAGPGREWQLRGWHPQHSLLCSSSKDTHVQKQTLPSETRASHHPRGHRSFKGNGT